MKEHTLVSTELMGKSLTYCVKSARIRSFSGTHLLRISQYSVRLCENTDQKNSKHEHFSRSDS